MEMIVFPGYFPSSTYFFIALYIFSRQLYVPVEYKRKLPVNGS
jgi:hypothetical protein